ncbi:MAG: sulfatase-like hydrolase/transferase [Acidobacteriota bacterium]
MAFAGFRKGGGLAAGFLAVSTLVAGGVESAAAAPGAPAAAARPSPPSILLISIDTLRADHLGLYGYPRPTDAGLARVAPRFVLFEHAYTPIPLTLPAHLALMNGLPPLTLGLLNNHRQLPRRGTHPAMLAERLAQQGYATAAVIASGVLESSTGMGAGFQVFDEPRRGKDKARRQEWEKRSAEAVSVRVAPLLERLRPPLFLFVHFYDAHEPFTPPDRYGCLLRPDEILRETLSRRGLDGVRYHQVLNRSFPGPITELGRPLTLEEMVGRYDASVRYVTDRVHELIDLWDLTPHGPGSLVIVTSDHGEGLGQHGFWSHGMNLNGEALQVPLMVRWPEDEMAGKRVAAPVTLLDIAPTVLEAAGMERPAEYVGVSLAAVAGKRRHREFLVAQRMRYLYKERPLGVRNWRAGDGFAIMAGPFKYIEDAGMPAALFDVNRDPFELHNLMDQQLAIETELRHKLSAWKAAMPAPRDWMHFRVDEERSRLLRSLGYLDR